MIVVLVYFSPNQTTRRISRELGEHFRRDGHELVEINIGKKENWDFAAIDRRIFEGADLLGFGCPVYHMSLPQKMVEFLDFMLPAMRERNHGLRVFIYLTYAGITSGKALLNAASLFEQNRVGMVGALKLKAPHFWHLNGYPSEHARGMVSDFYQTLKEKKFAPMVWDEIKELFSYQKAIVKIIYPLAEKIGESRNQPIHIDRQKCVRCRRCYLECPVHAIEMTDYPERDASKCMVCYHCTTVCPQGAIECDIDRVKKIVDFNKKIVGLEQPQDAIFG